MRIFNLKPEFQPPGFLPVAGILARNMIREGDLDGASNVLGKLIATGHADSAWYYLYAQMLVQANQIEDAVKILKDGLAKDPENQFLQSLLNQLIQPSENEEIPVGDSQSEDTNVDV
jgi:predicted Zn-dependent protease